MATRPITREEHRAIVSLLSPYLSTLPSEDRVSGGEVHLDWDDWREAFRDMQERRASVGVRLNLSNLGEEMLAYTVFDDLGRPWMVKWAHIDADIKDLDDRGYLPGFLDELEYHEWRHTRLPNAAHFEDDWPGHRDDARRLAGRCSARRVVASRGAGADLRELTSRPGGAGGARIGGRIGGVHPHAANRRRRDRRPGTGLVGVHRMVAHPSRVRTTFAGGGSRS